MIGPDRCARCGAGLEAHDRFCWNCGAVRVIPKPVAAEAPDPSALRIVRGIIFFFAGTTVLLLINATQSLAYVLSPAGRDLIATQLTSTGQPSDSGTVWFVGVFAVLLALGLAALNAAAFYGLRRRRMFGWILAIVAGVTWCLVLIGIPVVVLLMRPGVRRACGV